MAYSRSTRIPSLTRSVSYGWQATSSLSRRSAKRAGGPEPAQELNGLHTPQLNFARGVTVCRPGETISRTLLYNWPQLVIRARFTVPSHDRRSPVWILDAGTARTRSIIESAEQAAAAGNYSSAEKLLREAAALQEQTLGPHHPDLANTLNNLGVVCEMADNPIDAEHYFRRAYTIATATLAPDHPFVVTSQQEPSRFLRGPRTAR